MLSAVRPACPSCPESAIEKQPACAAAINSSGFVPLPSSKRVLNEYFAFSRTPLSVDILPLQSLTGRRFGVLDHALNSRRSRFRDCAKRFYRDVKKATGNITGAWIVIKHCAEF